MKKLKFFILLFALTTIITIDANSMWPRHHNDTNHNREGRSLGAPLDGGLLSVLGFAGIAYYVVKRKKKAGDAE